MKWPRVYFSEGDGGGGGGEPAAHWSDAHEGITSNSDVHEYCKRYATEADFAKGAYETKQKVGSSYRLPDDLKSLTEDQRTELMTKVRGLKTIPEKPEGYEIQRPEMPEELAYDENFESALRNFAHERGWENKDVQDMTNFFHKAMVSAYNRANQAEKTMMAEAERDYRLQVGPEFDSKMAGIGSLLRQAAEELGLLYHDDDKNLRSKLDDCLEMIREPKTEGGDKITFKQLGNMVPVLQLLSWVNEKYVGAGQPLMTGAGAPNLEHDFYKTVDKG